MNILAGEIIDERYRVVRLLGEGGYGAVYLAEDIRLGHKRVALKECIDKSAEAQEQFHLEAQLLASLNHPGLPRVSDHFIDQSGGQFLVMDYIEGEDLDARLVGSGRPFFEQEAVSLLLQICDTVAYLHTRRPQPVIHRDIKPTNIKITRDGRAILVDFGIAKIYHPQKSTAHFARAITPHFSSPEQHIGRTDTRSDVYSLGVTLYVLVTAQLPPDAMRRVNHNAPVIPPSQLNPAISPQLEQIIFQAMDLSADRRYMNASHMAAALRTLLQDHSLSGVAVRICPRCGWRNRAGARYCIRDGVDLDGTAPDLASKKAAGGSAVDSSSPDSQAKDPPPELLFESANALARSREYARAAVDYETCIQQGFIALATYYNLGICYLEMGRFSDAISIFEKAAARYPKDGDVQYQLARTYAALNWEEKALSAAVHACELDSEDPANLRQCGRLLFEAKRYAEAALRLEQAIQLDARAQGVFLLLGRCYGELGNLRQAVEALELAAKLEPYSPDACYWLGVYYLNANKRKQARSALEKALQISPDHRLSWELLKKV